MLNTEEFYKELLERYSFDEEKIRLAAIKQAKQPAIQKFAKNYWKPAAGIAAAVAVTVGVTAYASAGMGDAVNITVSPASALSASERLHEAELNYYNAVTGEEADIRNIYITFRSDMSYSDIVLCLSAITDTDEIKIDRLYLNNSTVADGDDTDPLFYSGKNIIGVKVCAPASLYRTIQDLSVVYLAELGSEELNDDTFAPIEIEDNDPLAGDIATAVAATSAPVTTTPFSFSQAPETTTEEEDNEADAPDMTTDTMAPPEEDEDGLEEEDDSEQTTAAETTEAVVETAETTAPVTEVSVTELITPSQGLLSEMYTLNVPNALETLLVNDYAIVLTKTETYIYKLGGMVREAGSKKAELSSPQVTYLGVNTVIVTGCGADGKRNKMLYINTLTGEMGTIDAASSIGDAEIGTIQYSVSGKRFFVKAVSPTGTYIYELTLGQGVTFRPLVDSSSAISLAGSKNDLLYYVTTNSEGKYVLYEFNCSNGVAREAAIFETGCSVKSGSTFGSFVIIPSDGSGTYIFDTSAADVVSAEVDTNTLITTANDKTFFKTEKGLYVLSNGVISEYEGRDVTFVRKPTSEFAVTESDGKKITVVRKSVAVWGS